MPKGQLIIPGRGSLTLEEEKEELAELDAQISNADGLIDLLKRAPIDGRLREEAIQSVYKMKEGLNAFREKCVRGGIGRPDASNSSEVETESQTPGEQ